MQAIRALSIHLKYFYEKRSAKQILAILLQNIKFRGTFAVNKNIFKQNVLICLQLFVDDQEEVQNIVESSLIKFK